jgi:23S rRNA (uridine2552-2'-O)-methyltransferase
MARYQPKDKYYQRAKEGGLRARSAFKLEELLDKAQPRGLAGKVVLDLGAAPGGWLQILARRVGPRGRVLGIDLVAIRPVGPNVATWDADVRDTAVLDRITREFPEGFDLVTSDMAPKTTGVAAVDCARSLELVSAALGVAERVLHPGGDFLCKVFMGPDLPAFLSGELKPRFGDLRQVRPDATREGSREIYLVAKGLKPLSAPG